VCAGVGVCLLLKRRETEEGRRAVLWEAGCDMFAGSIGGGVIERCGVAWAGL
jgi:hypothetical protein